MGTSVAGGDWSAPATRGELMAVKHDLQVEMKDLQLGIYRMIWIAAGAMTAVGTLLRFFWKPPSKTPGGHSRNLGILPELDG
nr:hypothetical protein [bacterium]